MIATAADYAWFEDRPAGLYEAYCLTLARGLSADEFLGRIGGRPEQARIGAAGLFEQSMDLWDEDPQRHMLIGVTTVTGAGGSWALGLEVNGYLGVTGEVVMPLSAGTMAVSHYRNVNAVDRFCWAENRVMRLEFEPLFPGDREGATPDVLVDVMREAGFDLDDEDGDPPPAMAAFALAEYLTGVRVTPELLETSSYTCGIVPVP